MSQKLQPVRGTKDLFFDEAERFRRVVNIARRVAERRGFGEIITPIFEFTEVFKRTLGDTSDVVNKEMYTFEDRGGESITLRPEFTAGVARAFISNGLQQNLPLKLFSAGPLFRYERPQKGRQRQFHQINFEYLGAKNGPLDDYHMILVALMILRKLGLSGKIKLHINSLGDGETRANYTKALVEYLQNHQAELSEDSKNRLQKNPLRILDSKDEGDRKILRAAPLISEFYSDYARKYFGDLLSWLKAWPGLEDRVVHDVKLVRGLDYYSHTVFEFIAEADEMGAQNTILAGGRYDGLIKTMGGPDTPAVGFAAGIERLMLLMKPKPKNRKIISIIVLGEKAAMQGAKLAYMLVEEGFYIDEIYDNALGKALKRADKKGAALAVILGDDELTKGIGICKDLKTGEQKELPFGDIAEHIESSYSS